MQRVVGGGGGEGGSGAEARGGWGAVASRGGVRGGANGGGASQPQARAAPPEKKVRAVDSIDVRDAREVMGAVKTCIGEGDAFDQFRADSGAYRRGEMDCADYYSSHSETFNQLDEEGLLAPMINLLPDEAKKTELRELREAYHLAADFASGASKSRQQQQQAPSSKKKIGVKDKVAKEREQAAERMRESQGFECEI